MFSTRPLLSPSKWATNRVLVPFPGAVTFSSFTQRSSVSTGSDRSSFFRYWAAPTYDLNDLFNPTSPPSSPCCFFQRNFKELGPGLVPVGERETVYAPGFREAWGV